MKRLLIGLLCISLQLMSIPLSNKVVAAESTKIVIYQLQTGGLGSGTASQEYILLRNNNQTDINITGWCIKYSSATNGEVFTALSCLEPLISNTELWIEANSVVSFATNEFIAQQDNNIAVDFIFNAGIAALGGHIQLLNESGEEVDRVGWGTALEPETSPAVAHKSGEAIRRIGDDFLDSDNNTADFSSQPTEINIVSGLYEKDVLIDLCKNIDDLQSTMPESMYHDESSSCFVDFCPNLDGVHAVAPVGFQKPIGTTNCIEIILESAVLLITELLPNPPSYDTGKEFIELYNPNNRSVNLTGYKLQLGPSFTKEYVFTSGVIPAFSYLEVSDSQTKLALPNTSANVRLISPAGATVSETGLYLNPKDTVSWVLFEDVWQYTNQITPSAVNKSYLEPVAAEVLSAVIVYAPCPEGKFRNPDTNRCKSLEVAVNTLTPCDEDEYRNPETNRCRKISASTTTLIACKVGQVRNPETNRCRAAATSNLLAPCNVGQARNPDTNRCKKVSVTGGSSDVATVVDVPVTQTPGTLNWLPIAIVIVVGLGYAIYEWRHEINRLFYNLRNSFIASSQ